MSDLPVPTPADVAPKAPEAPAATPEPAAAAPEATPAEPTTNPWDDPAAAKAEIERLRKENGKDRTTAKQTAAAEAEAALAAKIGKALGIIKDDEPADPAKLTEQLTETQREAKQARVELAVYKHATAAGADAQALLDSATFLAKAASLDPTDAEAVKAAIAEAVTANPRLQAAPATRLPAPNPAQGTSAAGGEPAQYDAAWVKRMTDTGQHAEIVKARQEGRLSQYLSS